MDRQLGADGIVVVEDNDIPISSQRFYTDVPSGEALLIASYRGWSVEESERAHVVRITKMLRLFDTGTPIQKYFSNSVLWESYGQIIPRHPPGRLSTASTLSYPPLTSDHSTYDELPTPDISPAAPQVSPHPVIDRSATLAANSVHTTTLSAQEKPEPLVLASVRQALARDSSYAEEVILSLKSLPITKRDILFNQCQNPTKYNASTTTLSLSEIPTYQIQTLSSTDPEFLKAYDSINAKYLSSKSVKTHPSVAGITYAPANTSGSSCQTPLSQSSPTKRGKKHSEKNRVQKSSRGKSKDKAALIGGGGSSDPGRETNSTESDRIRKSNSRWACPYSLAFTSMLDIARFKSCRPPGSLNSRSLWKDHLKEYHSPRAKLSNSNVNHTSFYMDDKQWEKVQARIAKETHRPRAYDEWFKIQKECFLEVWHIIFPEGSSSAPLSPFHPNSSLFSNLGPQIDILLETIHSVKAEQAVSTGSIQTVQDFHPTNEQSIEMMKDAIAIVINMSPGASQWLTNVSPNGLQASVKNHKTENAGSEALSSPEQVDPSSGSTSLDDSTDPAVATTPTPIPLFQLGTQISLQVSPNYAPESNQQPAFLKVTTPSGFFIDSMSRAPTFTPAPILPSVVEFEPNHQFVDPSFLGETTAVGQTQQDRSKETEAR
ncbi:hypothetical protein F4805DRAFT_424776 [Annulohypoxylon moriforme]|nr:hypothetical protein F4805DRAFT_424776 [Annulohypoxylon moriforme]